MLITIPYFQDSKIEYAQQTWGYIAMEMAYELTQNPQIVML
jgi:hypothetical protein